MMDTYKNPVLSGFYPDPSICRCGEDYYLVTSTFAYFPGVPVFHSRDLVNWRQIGNVLERPEQLDLSGAEVSHGIYAPTIRYYNGRFYMITTNVSHGGNFVVTADKPEGPWSKPYFLGSNGIDPSLFFDDDGRCYYVGTCERREGGAYYGDNEIYLRELDLENMQLVGESYALWHGALRDAIWTESPHLYKKDGYYYLMVAEGGTDFEHAVSIARSKSLCGPYKGCPSNPILTHRHLGRACPIVNVGHADLVETQNGDWYMVLLASRPYGGYYRNLGRETFLASVVWENGWPVVNYGKGRVEAIMERPKLPPCPVESKPDTVEFDSLPVDWLHLRNPGDYRVGGGKLWLPLLAGTIDGTDTVSFVCVRQRHMSFTAEVEMEFTPLCDGERAGLVLLQSGKYYYQFVYMHDKKLAVVRRAGAESETLAETILDTTVLRLRISAEGQSLSFFYSPDGTEFTRLLGDADGRILSTDVAGGFVGVMIGLYATANGAESDNGAIFKRFKYSGLED